MKNFKQIAFGLLLSALVIGFSAFTNAPQKIRKNDQANYRFYNRSGAIGNQSASNFVYDGGMENLCSTNPNAECTAVWTTSNTPSIGQSPTDAGSPSYVGDTSVGEYSGDQ